MAFVIFSTGSLASSRSRTLSLRAVVTIVLAGTAVLFAGGAAVGYKISRLSDPVPASSSAAASIQLREIPPESRMLIDRIGELTGRMAQLESEARELSMRVGILKEVEERAAMADNARAGRLAKTQPGKPSGGPLLSPEPEAAERLSLPAGAGLDPLDVLGAVEGEMERIAALIAELDESVVALNLAHMARPGREPVQGRTVVSSFGNRIDPFTNKRAFHSGVDFPAPIGTPILASAGGRVIFSGYRPYYGRTVEIDHGGGLVTRYAHASRLDVQVGQVVMPGDQIALVGNTGRSTGPHLHFEILRNGRFVDPRAYLAQFREP